MADLHRKVRTDVQLHSPARITDQLPDSQSSANRRPCTDTPVGRVDGRQFRGALNRDAERPPGGPGSCRHWFGAEPHLTRFARLQIRPDIVWWNPQEAAKKASFDYC